MHPCKDHRGITVWSRGHQGSWICNRAAVQHTADYGVVMSELCWWPSCFYISTPFYLFCFIKLCMFFFLLLLFRFEFFLVEFEHLCFLPGLVENKINEVSSVTSSPCEGSLYCGGGGECWSRIRPAAGCDHKCDKCDDPAWTLSPSLPRAGRTHYTGNTGMALIIQQWTEQEDQEK